MDVEVEGVLAGHEGMHENNPAYASMRSGKKNLIKKSSDVGLYVAGWVEILLSGSSDDNGWMLFLHTLFSL